MILDDRKKKILQAIVEDFVLTGEPVGSRTVAKKYNLGMSPATIRNDMADLEEMGLLQQPHTSAGRVPSDFGYREYVDKIMKCQTLSQEEASSINERLVSTLKEISHLVRQVSNVISQFTQYTSVAVTPKLNKSKIKHLQLVPIDKSKVLIVLVTDNGSVRNMVIKANKEYSSDFLFYVSNILNERFEGFPLVNINQGVLQQIENANCVEKDMLIPILHTLMESLYSSESSEVYLGGTSNIFNFPEFCDINKAKEFLDILDEKDFLVDLIGSINDERVNITIGSENRFNEIKGCSLITTSYWHGDKLIGSIGVIGPTRMNYAKVIACVEYLRKEITNVLKKISEE